MASKEQIKTALDELWKRYGNTLAMLSDSLDKIEEKSARISELERLLDAEPEMDLDLSTPTEVSELESRLANRHVNETE